MGGSLCFVAVFSILEKAKDYMKTTYLTVKQGGKKTRENASSLRLGGFGKLLVILIWMRFLQVLFKHQISQEILSLHIIFSRDHTWQVQLFFNVCLFILVQLSLVFTFRETFSDNSFLRKDDFSYWCKDCILHLLSFFFFLTLFLHIVEDEENI